MSLASARFVFFFPLLGGVLATGAHAMDVHDVNLEPIGQKGKATFESVTTTMLPTFRGRGLQTGEETCVPRSTPIMGVSDANEAAVSDDDGSVYITGTTENRVPVRRVLGAPGTPKRAPRTPKWAPRAP